MYIVLGYQYCIIFYIFFSKYGHPTCSQDFT